MLKILLIKLIFVSGEIFCNYYLVGEAVLMTDLEILVHYFLMKTYPPFNVCEQAGYCTGPVTYAP
jgi:hypothetical protein